MAHAFPGLGKTYYIDFKALHGGTGEFKVIVQFDSATSLRYWQAKNEKPVPPATAVAITITPVRDKIYLVSWLEPDAANAQNVIVHLEDYDTHKVITNYPSAPGNPPALVAFNQYGGTMVPKPHIP
jgi:hypothetical protein